MARRISGYAAVFGSRSQDLGGFTEQIDPKAFNAALANRPDVICCFNHNQDALLGRTASGTVRLKTDSRGLAYECDLPSTNLGQDVGELISRGDVVASSFQFIVGGDDWDVSANGSILRTITDVSDLLDVSPVTSPAYPDATVQIARSAPERSSESAEDAKWRAYALNQLESLKRNAKAKENEQRESMRNRLYMSMVLGGESQERAKAVAGITNAGTSTRSTGKGRAYNINGKPVTRSAFVAFAKERGASNIEARLKVTAGKAERLVVKGPVTSE